MIFVKATLRLNNQKSTINRNLDLVNYLLNFPNEILLFLQQYSKFTEIFGKISFSQSAMSSRDTAVKMLSI